MTSKTSIKTNIIFNSIYQLTNIFVPLVTLPYLSRILHAEGLGIYSFAYSVSYYFYILIRLGLQNYGNRTVAYNKDDPEQLSKVFCEIYAMQLFMGIVMSLAYLVYCVYLAPDKTLALIFFMVVLTGAIDLTWVLYGLEEFKVTSVRDIITKLLTAVLIFLFVKDADDTWKYALIFSAGFMINQIVVLPLVTQRVHYVRPELKNIVVHIKPNLILFLPHIAVSVYKTMDKIMLGLMSSGVELGYYHGSENIIRVPLAFVTALGTVMLPRMSNMISRNEGKDKLKDIFSKSITFVMFISSSICLGIMTVAKEFVPIFYGKGFDKCVDLFYIILPSCIFAAFANVIRTQYLLPRKKDTLFVISLFSGAAVNLVLNLILIPRFESIGAAIGTMAAEIMVCVVQAAFVYNEADIGRNIINSLPFVFAGIVMFVAFRNYTPGFDNEIVALGVKVIISGALYMAVLGLALLVKGAFTRTMNRSSGL